MLKKLNELRNNHSITSMYYEVAGDLLLVSENSTDLENYILEVIAYGCGSGVVTPMIYDSDIKYFFNRHVDEIFEQYEKLQEVCLINIDITMRNLTWLAYEETVREIAYDLGIDY